MKNAGLLNQIPTEIQHPLNKNELVTIKRIFFKNELTYVLKTKVKDLDVNKCSQKFLDLAIDTNHYVYLKCNLLGKLSYRQAGNKELYLILPYKDYSYCNPCLSLNIITKSWKRFIQKRKNLKL